jgi:hypothetical protein
MKFEGDCHEVEVIPNLELLVTFGMSFERLCHELTPDLEVTKNYLKSSLLIRYEEVMSLE